MPMIRSVLASVKKADETFALVDPGDVIAIGVSGGKDSMCLLYALHLYTKFSRKDFRIVPITLDLGFPGFDTKEIEAYCKKLGLELVVSDSTEVYPILQQHTKPGHHIPCSICSRMKKAAMNDVAKKCGCNKVAFAHHRDDALETLWMNMIHGGSISTFEPKMRLDRAGIDFIRPFIFVREEQLTALAQEEAIPVMGKTCPADGYTERQYCKDLLNALYEQRPEAITNFSSMLYDPSSFRLYFDHLEYPNPFNPRLTLKPLLGAKQALDYAAFASAHGLNAPSGEDEHFLVCLNHEPIGVISYRFDSAHTIIINAVDVVGEPSLAEQALAHFEDRMSRKINPILFVNRSKNPALCVSYHTGEPPFASDYIKRIIR